MRKTGLDIIGDTPWGTHFCQFYQTADDLLDILVPYFWAGLDNNEFCMWITSEPLDVDAIIVKMKETAPGFEARLRKGQIEIIRHTDWYLKDGTFDQQRVLDGWVDKLGNALANGYDGLRLTGNTFWLEKETWKAFTEYEEAVDRVIGNYNMLALCTYSLDRCGASEVIDVVQNHRFALIKREGVWKLIESSERRRSETAILERDERLHFALETSHTAAWDLDLVDHTAFRSLEHDRIFGYTELLPRWTYEMFLEHVLPEDREKVDSKFHQAVKSRGDWSFECRIRRTDGQVRWIWAAGRHRPDEAGNPRRMAGIVQDITDRKHAENERQRLMAIVQRERDRLSALVNSITDEIWFADAEKKLTLVNPAVWKEFGSGIGDVKDVEKIAAGFEVYRPDGTPRPVVEAPPLRALRGETVVDQEEIIRMPATGQLRYRQVNAAPVREAEGTIIGSVSVVRDITERKKAEEALKESEKQYRSLFENMMHGYAHCKMLYDEGGRPADFVYLNVNNAFEKLTGLEQVVGRRVTEVIPGIKEAHPELFDIYGRVAFTGQSETIEIEFKPLNLWLSISVYSPKREHFVAIFDDITVRKTAETKIKKHLEELQTANAELAIFNTVAVGRELRMIELKREINALRERIGEPPRYPLDFEKEQL